MKSLGLTNRLLLTSKIPRFTAIRTTFISIKRDDESDFDIVRKERVFNAISSPIAGRRPQWKSANDAVKSIKSGNKVFVHGIASTPTPLLKALCKHVMVSDVKDITLYHALLLGEVPWIEPGFEGRIRSSSLFTAANLRKAINDGRADWTSIFLSEIPWLFKRRHIDLDVALISVSTPDGKGFCSLGPNVDCTAAAVQCAKHVIAITNPNMPRTYGNGIIHTSYINTLVFSDAELHARAMKPPTELETKIGESVAQHLVDDGATLQMGIGAIPDACLAALKGHKHMGIHTELFSDGVLDLVNVAAVTNSLKVIHPGKIVSGIVYGSKKLYQFLHDNPMIMMGDIAWVNSTEFIRLNPKVTAINGAIEVDLTGQVVSDSIGKDVISGFGGQVDFIRGAALSSDGLGKPIIVLPSTSKAGSRIVPVIAGAAGVVTTRAHVHYVVTEYGIAQLFGRNMRQRAYSLINIAHPDYREGLEKAAFQRLKCMPSPD